VTRIGLHQTEWVKRFVALLALLFIVACGADGDPEKIPNTNATEPGTTKIGVVGLY
jgi:hypothetical protein